MVRDEGQVLAGLLMGLNAIDYNMTLSAEEFDKSVSLGRVWREWGEWGVWREWGVWGVEEQLCKNVSCTGQNFT